MNPVIYEYVEQNNGWNNTWEVSRIVPCNGKVIFGHIVHNGHGTFWKPAYLELLTGSFIINLGRKLEKLNDSIAKGIDPRTIDICNL